ncbi:MAG: biotin carboxylase N-terminal domain-containing protein [Candidatus Sericytochromatia bacterium]|nr:biotin carboxylase N-terminal domain-containing protein [Candidatus Sericytochromatia bacterium]
MMKKLLVANRGEIAIRIIRACRELGVATVAVYTELDRECRHIELADQAFSLGEATYLDMAALWAIAEQADCDAIHPGYGFLAENADFAAGTVTRGLTWVGPHAEAIAQMGSKLAARKLALAHEVPIVPGDTEPVTSAEAIRAFGAAHGYPILIKAAAGGGGRGQVVLNGPEEIEAGLERAQREGLNYFGDASVYIERYLTRPRHIEVQVVADKHGQVIHLGERDCTIQRRNQKLVEEAPSPAVDPALRDALGQAACRMARAVNYDSVGTCEFMVEDGRFYFLEMNTRIQVEHTVTEVIYRCDLVKEMLRIAAGTPLDPGLVGKSAEGWAIQVRLNAEDPSANYRPTPGYLARYVRPEGPGVRLDGAAYEGWTIPTAYDSMIAKLITWGQDRHEAIARMRRALKETVIEGVPTTVPLHAVIMENPTFIGGDFSTRFLQDCLTEAERARIKEAIDPVVAEGPTPLTTTRNFSLEVNRQRFEVVLRDPLGSLAVTSAAAGPRKPTPAPKGGAKSAAGAPSDGQLRAPMMSRVVKLCVAVGDTVKAGQPLVVIEAMKMESELVSPQDGVVQSLQCQAGDTVQQGQILASLA